MKWLLSNNGMGARLLRTIIQGIMGVIIANVDYFVGGFVLDPSQKTIIVALVMAVLSPIMAVMSQKDEGSFVD